MPTNCLRLIILVSVLLRLCVASPVSGTGPGKPLTPLEDTVDVEGGEVSVDLGSSLGLVASTTFSGEEVPDRRPWDFKWMIRRLHDDLNHGISGEPLTKYDIWPDAKNWVKFELRPYERSSRPRKFDRDVLMGLETLFATLSRVRPTTKPVTGVITSGHVTVFVFRLYHVPPFCGVPEKKFGMDLSKADLAGIQSAKKVILRETTKDDLLVFIGNTAGYIYYAFQSPGDPTEDHRTTRLIPYSGHYGVEGFQERIVGSTNYGLFKLNELLPAFKDQMPARVVLIDKTINSSGLEAFQLMLDDSGAYTGRPTFINILSNERGYNVRRLPAIDYLQQVNLTFTTLERLVRGRIGRVVPPYPLPYWHLDPAEVRYPYDYLAPELIRKIVANDIKA
ncbi:MAG: hypothetical protein M1825_002762 [Sarcosagium campestre]|nr:MAG: hypothetical protein M1825_002762 [Sarcosagium campestre]